MRGCLGEFDESFREIWVKVLRFQDNFKIYRIWKILKTFSKYIKLLLKSENDQI